MLVDDNLNQLGYADAFNGTFYIQCGIYSYQIDYYTPSIGVVLYTVKEITDFDGEYYRVYVPKLAEIKEEGLATRPQPISIPAYRSHRRTGYTGGGGGGGGIIVAGLLFSVCASTILRQHAY